MTDIARRFLAFAGVGVLGTAAHFAVLTTLVEFAGLDPRLASGFGFAVGAIVNYVLNYRFTFASNRRHTEAAPRFFAVAALGCALNILFVHIGAEMLSLHYLVSQVLSTGIVLVFNFVANSVWTFAARASLKQ